MSDPVIHFHHYDSSPFSEKVRILFGIHGVEWHAVEQPVIMPKPDLTCLTGGYRKIPVLQVGAEVYCDSQLIVREIERRFAAPDPQSPLGLVSALAFWSDRELFQAAVAVIFGAIGDQIDESFRKDREQLSGRPFDPEAMKAVVPMMSEQLRAHCRFLDRQLEHGNDFLLGDRPSAVDATAYYNLWFVRSFNPPAAALFDSLPRLGAWEKRVAAIGHGHRIESSATDAVEAAREAEPDRTRAVDSDDPAGLSAGEPITVQADDYGRDPISGTLLRLSADEVVLLREDERIGDVAVHFPRAGFIVSRSPG